MSVEDAVKIALALLLLSGCFAIIGISIQVIRISDKINKILSDTQQVSHKLSTEITKLEDLRQILSIVFEAFADTVLIKSIHKIKLNFAESIVNFVKIIINKLR